MTRGAIVLAVLARAALAVAAPAAPPPTPVPVPAPPAPPPAPDPTPTPTQQPANGVAIYHARQGDTLELIAAEYYGDRNDAVFIMVENHILRPKPLHAGDRLRIPVSRDYTTEPGDTFASLAATYLGDARRGPFLAEFNSMTAERGLTAGTTLSIPFHVTHTAGASETLGSVAETYLGNPNLADMLQRYNFLEHTTLDKGESIVVPIFHVRVRAAKLPPIDAQSQARRDRRQADSERAAAALPIARAAWHDGDFGSVMKALQGFDLSYLDAGIATEIGQLLGSAYMAYDQTGPALVAFKQVLDRDPNATLDAYAASPKVIAVWQHAHEH